MHLIDRLVDYEDRRWLQAHLHTIALATLDHDGATQSRDRERWLAWMWNPGTMKREQVRVVLDLTSNEVLNAIPIPRRGTFHAHRR